MRFLLVFFFFFNDTATTEIYTLSLHDALPIYPRRLGGRGGAARARRGDGDPRRGLADPRLQPRAGTQVARAGGRDGRRSEEHTSELQSRQYLVCRLLLEKKKKTKPETYAHEGR